MRDASEDLSESPKSQVQLTLNNMRVRGAKNLYITFESTVFTSYLWIQPAMGKIWGWETTVGNMKILLSICGWLNLQM